MRIFVTGGSGFVGGHVIEALVEAGHDVLAMARSERSAAIVEGFGATALRTSLGQVPAQALKGCDQVIHAAGFVQEWGTREQFEQGNIEGTGQLLDVAQQAGVKRFIFIGTEASFFTGQNLIDIDETQPYPQRHRFLYSETKARAEALVLSANSPHMTTLSLRPRFVWGPRDTSVLPAVMDMVNEGRFVWLDQGQAQTSTTHIRNLCHAVLQATTHGHGGQAYFIADAQRHSLKSFLTALVQTQGVQLKARSLPGALLRPLSTLVGGLWRLLNLNSTPPIHAFPIAMMSRTITVRTDKAQRDLHYHPVIDFQQGMAELGAVD